MQTITKRVLPFCSKYSFAIPLIENHWDNTYVKTYLPLDEHSGLLRDMLECNDTFDSYLYLDDGTLIASVIMTEVEDHHIGKVAVPLVCYVHSEYRSTYTAKWVLKQERKLTLALGLAQYQRCKHIDRFTTQFKLKRVSWVK